MADADKIGVRLVVGLVVSFTIILAGGLVSLMYKAPRFTAGVFAFFGIAYIIGWALDRAWGIS